MAKTAALVTMLQRSPTCIVSRPTQERDRRMAAPPICRFAPAYSHGAMVQRAIRPLFLPRLSRRKPEAVKQWIVGQARQQLGDDYDVTTHFTPSYNPWDQRLCLAPDADFFRAIKSGKADVVTDQIEASPKTGIRLKSGGELQSRYHRDRNRPEHAVARRHSGCRRRQTGEIFRHDEFQRRYVQRRAEFRPQRSAIPTHRGR